MIIQFFLFLKMSLEVTDFDDEKIGEEGKKWITEKVKLEAERMREYSVVPLIFKVNNFGIVHDDNGSINRIEFASNFDFKKILQIMISDPIVFPYRINFLFSTVLLMTEETSMPIIVPYLYQGVLDKKVKLNIPPNNLKEWLLINSKHERARHSIDQFVRE
ncbi:hypothetical protein BC833DRAFT_230621 [Globomyces pollinis-pini]|nr:hypothetical protein BC833DRAFT_230621 [Globomyces pollinis-pini]